MSHPEKPAVPMLDVPMEGRSTRQGSPVRLSTELTLKVQTQRSRIDSIKELGDTLPHKEISLEEVLQIKANVENLHKAFAKEHAYFEASWPSTLVSHEYFAKNAHGEEARAYAATRRAIGKLQSAIEEARRPVTTTFTENGKSQSKLPEIALPKFSGDYAEWPAFRDLFGSLILDNRRLTDVERLHYLRGCIGTQPAQLIGGFPLTGESLQPSWETLVERYENKQQLINSYFDQLFEDRTPIQRNAASIERLTSSMEEAKKVLRTLGSSHDLWDYSLVYHVTKRLDSTTREHWETSLGATQKYPSSEQLGAILNAHARALERVETAASSPISSSSKSPPRKSASAHQTSANSPSSASSSSVYPGDCKQ